MGCITIVKPGTIEFFGATGDCLSTAEAFAAVSNFRAHCFAVARSDDNFSGYTGRGVIVGINPESAEPAITGFPSLPAANTA